MIEKSAFIGRHPRSVGFDSLFHVGIVSQNSAMLWWRAVFPVSRV